MNLKRATLVSVLIYAISFAIGFILMFKLGINAFELETIPSSFYYLSMLAGIILTAVFTIFYFKDKKLKPSLKEGFLFGVVLIVVGSILDVIIFSIGLASGGPSTAIIDYYSNPFFWATIVLLLATSSLVGWIKSRK